MKERKLRCGEMLNDKKKIHWMKVHTFENDTVNLCSNSLSSTNLLKRGTTHSWANISPAAGFAKSEHSLFIFFFFVVVVVIVHRLLHDRVRGNTKQKLKIPSLLRSTLAQLILCQWKRWFTNGFTCDIIEAMLFIC